MKEIIDNFQDGLIFQNENNEILYQNKVTHELFGTQPDNSQS